MSITAATQRDRAGVDDLAELGPVGVLGRVGAAETAERRAGLEKLELALRWCVLHPATVDTGTAVWGDAGFPGLEDCEGAPGRRRLPAGGGVRTRAVRGRAGGE